jgi:hypothetical protein
MRWFFSSAALLLVATATSIPAQSLNDAAQKEKERRQKVREQSGGSSRVVTDEELKSNGGKLANGPSAASPSPSPRAGGGSLFQAPSQREAGDASARTNQESEWRSRARAAQARIERAQKAYEALRDMYLVNGEYYADKNGRPVVTSVEELQKLTAEAKAELEAAQKAFDDLQESARHQSVPPGWLR